jgi:hypothetical protein
MTQKTGDTVQVVRRCMAMVAWRKTAAWHRKIVCLITTCGLVLSGVPRGFAEDLRPGVPTAQANTSPVPPKPKGMPILLLPFAPASVIDVSLGPGGALSGRVIGVKGTGLANVEVEITEVGSPLKRATRTNADGAFEFNELRTGLMNVCCGTSCQTLRVWAPSIAPPSARRDLVLANSDALVFRGQQPFCSMFCSEPLMIGVLAAAAIAIPLALHNSGDDEPASN